MPTISKRRDDGSKAEVTVSNRTIIRSAVVVVIILIILWGADKAKHAILLIFISFFFALVLNGPVYFIAKHMPGKLKGSRPLGTTISYLVVLLIVGAFLAYVGPPLVHQTENFIHEAPKIISEFEDQSGSIGQFIRHYHLQKEVSTLSKQLSARVHGLSSKALPAVYSVGKSIFSVIVIIVMTFMMLVEGPRWLNAFKRAIPRRRHEMADRMAGEMYRVIRGYVNGQVLLALIAAAFVTPALYVLGISHPVALIVVVFVCGLIPMIGHTIGAVIVTIVALFHSLTAGIAVLVWYILYIQIENYFIQPKLQANTTKMSPLLVFASLIVGLDLAGLIGGLIAIPVAACLRIAVLEILRSNNIISNDQLEEIIHETSNNATEDQ